MKSVLWLGPVLLALACAGASSYGPGPVQYETGSRAAATLDGLHRVKLRYVDAAYLRPGADFSGYRGVFFTPVRVFYKNPPASPRGFSRDNYALEPGDMERLKNLLQDALENEFAESQVLSIASEPAPDVLKIRAHLVDLVVLTPPDRRPDRVYVGSSGKLKLILDASDSLTGQPLARLTGHHELTPPGTAPGGIGIDLNRGFEWGQLRRIFRKWSAILRGGLEVLPTLGPVPPAPTA